MDDQSQPANQAAGEVGQVQGELPITADVNSEVAKVRAEKELLEKRYADSSREAKKLYEEKVKAQAELEALRQHGSLKTDSNVNTLNRDAIVQSLIEKHGFDEKLANVWAEDKIALANELQAQRQYTQTIVNFMKNQQATMNQGLINLDPVAKQADEFCQGLPGTENMSVPEKVNLYKTITEKMGQKVQGRDLSEVKRGASGSVGGAAPASRGQAVTDVDAIAAKQMGWPVQAYKDYQDVHDEDQHAAWTKKWGKQVNLS